MSERTFVILGPGDDDDDIPKHWNKATWQWVEDDGTIPETLFTRTEVFNFPPGELPLGVQGIIDTETGRQWELPRGKKK